ncbi:hypothetical protein GF327_10135 [Candidatus Woesearchaeota archaeon]|nr:hypothetical protein [Candidatus Woesearchaeota archaeon]
MNSDVKIVICLFFLILLCNTGQSIKITGETFRYNYIYEPGFTNEYSFNLVNNDGQLSNYKVFMKPYRDSGDFSDSFEVIPEYFENVAPGESKNFRVKLNFIGDSANYGENMYLIGFNRLNEKKGITATASVAIVYEIFVLYPYKYMEWSLSAPNLNINEKKKFKISFQNLGKKTIDSIQADIDIYNLENDSDLKVKQIKSSKMTGILPREKDNLNVEFDSTGLSPGNYKAVATLNWDENISIKERLFKIGSKNVLIHNFTKEFSVGAINKMDIDIESNWNTLIENIYADIEVYEEDTNNKLSEFKSFNTNLEPWEKKSIDAYFDTTDIKKGQYLMKITLYYEGAKTEKQGMVDISDITNAETVKEIPGKITFKSVGKNVVNFVKEMNPLILLMILLVVVNFFLIGYLILNKSNKEKKAPDDIIEIVKKLSKIHSNEEIVKMLSQKGWSEEHIDMIMKEIK